MADERDGSRTRRRGVSAREPSTVRATQPGPAEASTSLRCRAGRVVAGRTAGCRTSPAHRHAATDKYRLYLYLAHAHVKTWSIMIINLYFVVHSSNGTVEPATIGESPETFLSYVRRRTSIRLRGVR